MSLVQGVANPVTPPPPAAAPRAGRVGSALRGYLPAVLVALGGLVLWEVLIRGIGLSSFILPAPSAIAAALVENWNGERFPLAASARNTFATSSGTNSPRIDCPAVLDAQVANDDQLAFPLPITAAMDAASS